MNIYKAFVLSAVVGSILASAALAGDVIGTEKARGHFGGGGWTQLHEGRHHVNRGQRVITRYSQPAMVQSAVVASTAPTEAAQTPAEGRRFSYAPALEAAASQPAVSSVSTIERAASVQPMYTSRGQHRQHIDKWALPKTDPRKYSSR